MKKLRFPIIAIAAVLFVSCSNDDDKPTPVNEEELITTVVATFTPQDGGEAITLTSRDLDGDGPNAPVVDVSGNFAKGATYNGAVTFANEMASPAEDITAEVKEESDEHQVFYQQNGLGSFTYTDADANDKPVGLTFRYTAAEAPANGPLTIALVHEPNKEADGVAQGIITNAGGSTDAEVIFNIVVE